MHRPPPGGLRLRTLEQVQAIVQQQPAPPPPRKDLHSHLDGARDARTVRLESIRRFRNATAGLSLVDIFRECLRAFAANEELYGPLSTIVHHEYNRMVREIATTRDKLCTMWMSGEQQLGGGGGEQSMQWDDSKEDAIAGLEGEIKQLTTQLADRDRKINSMEATAGQLKVWIHERNQKIEELQAQLERSREVLDDRRRRGGGGVASSPITPSATGGPAAAAGAATTAAIAPAPDDDPDESVGDREDLVTRMQERMRELESTASELNSVVIEQTDKINLLSERLDFVQDLLRSKVHELQHHKKEAASLRETLASRPPPKPQALLAEAGTQMDAPAAPEKAGRDKGKKGKRKGSPKKKKK